MSEKKTGGPAYPQGHKYYAAGQQTIDTGNHGGMTMRDYFAAKAINGFCMGHARLRDEFDPKMYDLFARHSYEIADKMLKAREE